MIYRLSLVISSALILFLSLASASAVAQVSDAIDTANLDWAMINKDGREPVMLNGHVYTISDRDELLEDGVSMDMPFAAKIFGATMPGMTEPHLFVWFLISDSRWVGHSAGVYVYRPESYNAWDQYQTGTPNSSYITDVTVFKDQLFILSDSARGGELFYPVMANSNNYGTFASVSIGVHANYFLRHEDGLYVLSILPRGYFLKSGGGLPAYNPSSAQEGSANLLARNRPLRVNGAELPLTLIRVR